MVWQYGSFPRCLWKTHSIYLNLYCMTFVPSVRIHLGNWGGVGDGGRLRCLHDKIDTTISCMCTCSVGSAQRSGCVVYGPGAMAAI